MDSKLTTAELKKSYADSVQQTNRFTLSTLIILLILVVIVEQELLALKFQEVRLRREAISTAERLDRFAKSLGKQQAILSNRIGKLSSKEPSVSELQVDDLPNLCRDAAATVDKLKKAEVDLQKIEKAQKGIVSRLSSEADPKKANRNNELISSLDEVLRLIKPYKKDYEVCLSLGQRAASTRSKLEEMRNKRQAIPTPFGNFEVHPKLALMALAFAAALAYLSFGASVVRIRRLAREYFALHQEEGQVVALDQSPPFWLYDTDNINFSSIFSGRTESSLLIVARASLHLGWVSFAGWLVYESRAWMSSGALLFRYKHLADHLLLALLAVAIGVALSELAPRFSRERISSLIQDVAQPSRGLNRRKFLAVCVTGLIVGGALYVRFRRGQKRANNCTHESDSALLKSYEYELILNLRTQVIHHGDACRNHLPRLKNRVSYEATRNEILPSSCCLHASTRSRILEQLAIRDASHRQGDSAIVHLREAIATAPLSFHLYDRLIGMYGRLKQYEKIELLLKEGRARVQEMKSEVASLKKPESLRAQKRIKRAEDELELRYRTYIKRKKEKKRREGESGLK